MRRESGRRRPHRSRFIVGLVLLCGCAAFALARPAAFCVAWLVAWWLWASLALGAQANRWLHDLTGGEWGRAIRPHLHGASNRFVWLSVLLVPLVVTMPSLYPWARYGWSPSSANPAFQALWLSYGFVIARVVLYVLILNALVYGLERAGHAFLARRRCYATSGAAIGLIVWGYTVSLLSVDLIMSLTPQWYSSGFGFVVITVQMKLGFTWAVMWAAPRATPAVRRDLGNLLMMYVLMSAYLAYSQFAIIWAENLPSEIVWYVDRIQTGWQWLGICLVVFGLFVPLILLLFRAIKENAAMLQGIAALLCVMAVIETMWMVLPSAGAFDASVWWMIPLAMVGMGLLLFASPPGGYGAPSSRRIGGQHGAAR